MILEAFTKNWKWRRWRDGAVHSDEQSRQSRLIPPELKTVV